LPLIKPTVSFYEPLADEIILVSSAQRDPAEFAALYDRYFRPIYHYLYSRVGSIADTEDLTAQTFLAALEALPRYHHRGHFAAWLFTIAHNKARDFYRNETSNAPLDDNHPDASTDPTVQIAHTDQLEQLADLVSMLEENEQELIRLRCVADLSFADIGVRLGRKEDTVKKIFYRLLARLQHQLEVSHD
jgi:RNA polymerase sigma-70 factor (ECF subfamily)